MNRFSFALLCVALAAIGASAYKTNYCELQYSYSQSAYAAWSSRLLVGRLFVV